MKIPTIVGIFIFVAEIIPCSAELKRYLEFRYGTSICFMVSLLQTEMIHFKGKAF